VLVEVLAAQPGSSLAVLAAALGCDPRQSSRVPSEATIDIGAAVTELMAIASLWPSLVPAARSLALRVHAAVLLDVELEAPVAVALAAAVLDQFDSRRVEPTDAPRRDAIVRETRASINHGDDLEDVSHSSNRDTGMEQSAMFVATHYAGLFFLLDRVMELDLAESLWRACLPEGAVLAAAASALLGPSFAGDIAPSLFGGIDKLIACPEVTPEQHAEVATRTIATLAAALPRRGLAVIPPVRVSLVDHPAGRLLVASPVYSPFPCFAWPTASPKLMTEGLRVLLDAWPHGCALTETPALATLAGSGRLRVSREVPPASIFRPEASSAAAAALLMIVAGAPCLLFAARASAHALDTAQTFVARYLAGPARIRLAADRMDVIFGSDELDLDVRRAGLDRDPGWLPWLRRTVRFVFKARDLAGGDQ
jgi:hypothetical protein